MQTATACRAIADITVHTNRHTGIGIPNPAIATIVTGSQDTTTVTTVTTVVATALPFDSVLVATTAAGGDFDRVNEIVQWQTCSVSLSRSRRSALVCMTMSWGCWSIGRDVSIGRPVGKRFSVP